MTVIYEWCDERKSPTRHEHQVQYEKHYRNTHKSNQGCNRSSQNIRGRSRSPAKRGQHPEQQFTGGTRSIQNSRSRSHSPVKRGKHPPVGQSMVANGSNYHVNKSSHSKWNQCRNSSKLSQQTDAVAMSNGFHLGSQSYIPIHSPKNQPSSDRSNRHTTGDFNPLLESHNITLSNPHKYPTCTSEENLGMFGGYGMYPGTYPGAGIHLNITSPTGYMNGTDTHSKNRNQPGTVASPHHKVHDSDHNAKYQRHQNGYKSALNVECTGSHLSGLKSGILETNLDSPDEEDSRANNYCNTIGNSTSSKNFDSLCTDAVTRNIGNNTRGSAANFGDNDNLGDYRDDFNNIGSNSNVNRNIGNTSLRDSNGSNGDIPPVIPPKTYKQTYSSDAKLMYYNVQKVQYNEAIHEEKVERLHDVTKEQHEGEKRMNSALWKEKTDEKNNNIPEGESWSESNDTPCGIARDLRRGFTRSRSCVIQPPKVCFLNVSSYEID